MKFLFSLVILASLSVSAYASYYQTNCSNADATVQYMTGHSENRLIVSYNELEDEDAGYVKAELKGFKIEVLSSKEIERESKSVCEPGQRVGIATSRILDFKKVVISKLDGSKMDERIIGLSQDQKSLTVDYLCETVISSRGICQ